jgi:hypothetical protein
MTLTIGLLFSGTGISGRPSESGDLLSGIASDAAVPEQ